MAFASGASFRPDDGTFMTIAPQDPPKGSAFSPTYAFGSFRFDPARGMLYRGDAAVPLPERLGQLLGLLIRANGMVLDKETIATRLWPAEYAVSDGNLCQYMYMLRQLLHERASDRNYVVTVRGKGYRFVAPIRVEGPAQLESDTDANDDNSDDLLRSTPELLHHYWRGCNLLEKRTASALAAAAEEFEAALRIDSENVPALIGLGRSHALIAEYCYAPGSYAFSKAKAAIVRALEIDPSSAEARAMLGDILLFCDWNWAEAERQIETAVRLKQRSSSVYVSAAWFYMCKGDSEQLRRMEHALLLESSSPSLQLFLARIFLHTGDYRRAIDSFSNLIESGSDCLIARRHRAQAYILSGRSGEAVADLLLLPQDRAEDIALRLPLLARAYADCGDTERAEAIYRTLLDLARTDYVVGFNLATIAVGLRRFDEALNHLQWGLQRHEPALLMLRSLTWFKPITHHPRFKALLRAIWPSDEAANNRAITATG